MFREEVFGSVLVSNLSLITGIPAFEGVIDACYIQRDFPYWKYPGILALKAKDKSAWKGSYLIRKVLFGLYKKYCTFRIEYTSTSIPTLETL